MVDLYVTLRSPITQHPAFLFEARLRKRTVPAFQNINKQVTIQLTATAKRNLNDSKVREWETGQRKRHRLTGTLTGHSGRRSAIKARQLERGAGRRAGRGVGFPDVKKLDKRARHWRTLEYGTPFVTIPAGVFTSGLSGDAQPLRKRTPGDVFQTYGEFIRRKGLRGGRVRNRRVPARSAAARRKVAGPVTDAEGKPRRRVTRPGTGEGWEGKFFLNKAWNEVVGPDGENIARKFDKAIRDTLGPLIQS